MSLITRIIGAFAPEPNQTAKSFSSTSPVPSSWFGGMLGGSSTGTPATPYSALQTCAYACCRVLAEDCARLPIALRRRLPTGGFEDDRSHPVARLLRSPNGRQTAFEFVSHLVWSLSLRGNAYAYIVRAIDGTPIELVALLPDRVSVLLNPLTGDVAYQASASQFGSAVTKTIAAEDMIHIRNVTLDGIMGLSPIAVGQQVLAQASAMIDHAGSVFKNGTMLRGLLTTDGTISPEKGASLGAQWNQVYAGSHNAHRVAVLEDGLRFQPMSLSPVESALLEQRKYSTEDIARIFRVPLHKIGAASIDTKGNTEVLESGYVNDSLMPIIKRIEEALEMRLLFDAERDNVEIKFDLDSMLRSDMQTRFSCYSTGLMQGIFSINEVRAKEGMSPIDEGDTYRIPMNMAALNSDSLMGTTMTTPGVPAPDNQLLAKPSTSDDEDDE